MLTNPELEMHQYNITMLNSIIYYMKNSEAFKEKPPESEETDGLGDRND